MTKKRNRGEYLKAWRAAHPGYEQAKWEARKADPAYRERERLRSGRRRKEAKDKINEWARERHAERVLAEPAYRKDKAKNALKWQKNNRSKVNASSTRREFQKANAVPIWADKEHIQTFYDVADAYKAAFGINYEVDHIVPLRSPLVCGLHVGENLQLLPPYLNKSKGNRHWPDMP